MYHATKNIEDIFDVLCSLYVSYKLTILGYCYPRTHSLGLVSFLGGQVFFVICWAHRVAKEVAAYFVHVQLKVMDLSMFLVLVVP